MGRIAKLLLGLVVIAAIIYAIWHFNKNNNKTVGDHVGEVIDAVPAVTAEAVDEVTDSSALASTGEALEDTGEAAGSALSKAGKATSSAVSKATDGRDETRSSAAP